MIDPRVISLESRVAMFSVEQAQESVLSEAIPLEVAPSSLPECLGHVLAEDVVSDIDMPPFHKSLVDGFAVRSSDLPQGRGELAVVGEIVAGMPVWPDDRMIVAGQAVRIMTGAPMPPGSDAVVMVERTSKTVRDLQEFAVIQDPQLRSGQNIMRRGMELTCGQTVLRAGAVLRPAEIGVLAAVGRGRVSIYPSARVAIVCTGNELVEVQERPASGQIRSSNGPVLTALVTSTGAMAQYLGIARDTTADLEKNIRMGLTADILLLSGGVSAGNLDLVPSVLRTLGVRELFHKVNFKPGKPVWFGVAPRSGRRTLVFGLPGNPVSVMACFELFVAPAIRKLMGWSDPGPRAIPAILSDERSSRSDRPTYWPAWLEHSNGDLVVRLVAWKGSPDLRATTEANCFAIFPAGEHQFRRGDRIDVLSTSAGLVAAVMHR